MDNLIPKFYKDYGEYTNSSRAFPLDIDGAKPIERRVLLTAYEICKDHFVKSAKLEGSCLSGDTKIKLSSGNVKTIEEIYNESLENFYVFAFDIKNKRPVMTKVDRVKLTKKVKKLVIIETESGVVKCDLDHYWLTKSGKYVKAKNLKTGDCLESIEFGITDENNYYKKHYMGMAGYEVVEYEDKILFSHYLADEFNLKINNISATRLSENFNRHHRDFNRLNNNPENIERVTPKEHSDIHYDYNILKYNEWYENSGKEFLIEHCKKIHNNNPQIVERLVIHTKKRMKENPELYANFTKSWWKNLTPEERNKNSEKITEGILKHYSIPDVIEEKSRRALEYWKEDSEKVRNRRQRNSIGGYKTCYSNFPNNHKIKILKTIKILLDKGIEINEKNFNDNRLFPSYPLFEKVKNYFNTVEEAMEESKSYKNHTVLKIEIVDVEEMNLYDLLNSEFYNNFVVIFDDNTGIISHNCMACYSPHASAYKTIVQLVHQGFLDGQGNFGSSIGSDSCEAAASRYTEIKLNKDIKDLAFSLINYVDRVESELDPEPPYLPTKFPLCLLGTEFTEGIGFGFKTFIPCYNIEDLKKRMLALLLKEKLPTIKPLTDCEILSGKNELEELLTTGKATIKVKGKYKIDALKFKIHIKSWPPGKKFETILSLFDKELIAGEIGWVDLSANDETNIVFEVTRQRGKEEIFKKITKKIDLVLTGNINFEMIVVDLKRKVRIASVDEMLLNTFTMYKNVNKIMLTSENSKINEQIDEMNTLFKLKPFIKKYIKSDLEVSDIIEKISSESKINEKIIKELFGKYTIIRLLSSNTDTSNLKNKLNQFKKNLDNLHDFVLKQY